MLRKGAYFRVASWDEALDEVAARLSGRRPRRHADARLGRSCQRGTLRRPALRARGLDGAGVDSTARDRCPGGRPSGRACSRCRSRSRRWPPPIGDRRRPRHAFLVLGGGRPGAPRRAPRRRLVVVDARESNLARIADVGGGRVPATRRVSLPVCCPTCAPAVRVRPAPRRSAARRSAARPAAAPWPSSSGRVSSTVPAPASCCPSSKRWPPGKACPSCRLPTAPTCGVRWSSGRWPGSLPGPRPATGGALDLARLRAGQLAQGALPRRRGAVCDAARLRARDRPGPLSAALRGRRLSAGGVVRRGRGHAHQHRRAESRSCAGSSTSRPEPCTASPCPTG